MSFLALTAAFGAGFVVLGVVLARAVFATGALDFVVVLVETALDVTVLAATGLTEADLAETVLSDAGFLATGFFALAELGFLVVVLRLPVAFD